MADVLGPTCSAHVTRRRRELHQLGDRARVDSKPSRLAGPLLRRYPAASVRDFCCGALSVHHR